MDARRRKVGAALTRGELILFRDDDAWIEDRWVLSNALEMFPRHRLSARSCAGCASG
jgi:hypothetical protein